MTYFDAKKDREIMDAGGFFCKACLVGEPLVEQSLDLRYCRFCYGFLKEEAKLVGKKKPRWIPQDTPPQNTPEPPPKPLQHIKKPVPASAPTPLGVRNSVPTNHRGRKPAELPVKRIREMATTLSSRRISGRLLAEYGLIVSYKTIQRVLKGDGKLSNQVLNIGT